MEGLANRGDEIRLTEVELVRRAKSGDRLAVAELVDAHSQQAYRLALHIIGDKADAEDATQNALIKALANLGRFDERRPFAPWLLRIVAHEVLNLKRAERTRFAFWQRQAQFSESDETLESAVLVRAQHQELWRAVNRLKAEDQLVLSLGYFMGMGEAEIAMTLGIKPGTVKSRKHNALARLRTLVEREFPGLRPDVLERPATGGAKQ